MEIFARNPVSVIFGLESPKASPRARPRARPREAGEAGARPGQAQAGEKGDYQEFLFGLNILLGEKWDEKNPYVDEFESSRWTPCLQDGAPAKQFQTIDTTNRERVLSAIHQKEMTKWQTHP